MQIGVDRFSGVRLRQALDYSLVTAKSLADAVGVSPSNITKYISGDLKPSPNVFDQIRVFLKFPEQFFLDEAPVVPNGEIKKWRSLKAATKRARKKGESILEWQIESHNYFRCYFDFPRFQSLEFETPIDHKQISSESIEQLTARLREIWGIGTQPIKNLTRIVECFGICVCRANFDNEKQDAVSCVRDGIPYILLNSQIQSSSRLRFNVAHELGHILLHSSVTQCEFENEDVFDELEEQAHYFASALLLPEAAFTNDFWAPTLKCLEGLKKKWNVSIQAMMRRALELNLITSAQFGYLNIGISKRGWRVQEPLDDVTPIEKPRLFEQSLERMSSDHGKTPIDILSELPFPSWIAEELWAVPSGTFIDSSVESPVNILPFRV
jgi:Zn-dependent peptidase ImmA (M78 family)/transcriptional regulator with XRE-family HTH domain